MPTPPTPHKEAVEAAKEIQSHTSFPLANGIIEYNAQIITASYSATIARKDELLRKLHVALDEVKTFLESDDIDSLECRCYKDPEGYCPRCSAFIKETAKIGIAITTIENELKGSV